MKTTLILGASFIGNAVAQVVTEGHCKTNLGSMACREINNASGMSGIEIASCQEPNLKYTEDVSEAPEGCSFIERGTNNKRCRVNWNEPNPTNTLPTSQNAGSLVGIKKKTQGPSDWRYYSVCAEEVLPSANQDPHITNAYGQHFQLRQEGRYNMLSVSQKQVSEFKLFADLFRIDQKACAPAYIRTLNIITGQTTLSIRRGIPNNFSATTISDGFNVQMANQEWIAHSSFSQQQYSIGDLKVDFGGSVDCRDTANERSDCKHVVVVAPHVQVRVEGGQSPNGELHFLNLQIVKLNTSEATVSGLLWEDKHDQLAHC